MHKELAALAVALGLILAAPLAAQTGPEGESDAAPAIELPLVGRVELPGFLSFLATDDGSGEDRSGGQGADQGSGGGQSQAGGQDGGTGEQQSGSAPAVVVATVERESVGERFEFIGRIAAIERVAVQARVSGFIEEVLFEGGEAVEAGDPLFEIEPDRYEAALASAEAQRDGAEAQAAEAERALARATELRESNTVSQAELDDARARFASARAEVGIADAAVRRAALDLRYTTIEAAIDGRMSEPLITTGNFVGQSSGALAEIVQLDPVWGVFPVGENRLVAWRRVGMDAADPASPEGGEAQADGAPSGPGETRGDSLSAQSEGYVFSLILPDGSDYDAEGDFAFVANTVDASTGAIEVRVSFPNPDGLLLPNQNVSLVARERDPPVLPIVPQSAIQLSREGRSVWVVNDDDTVSRRTIEIEPLPDRPVTTVTRGLDGGERIVVRGTMQLSDGARVAPRTQETASNPPGGGEAGGTAPGGEESDG